MRKISALFLVFAMLLTMVPFAALAEDAAPTLDEALNVQDGTLNFTAKDWDVVTDEEEGGRVYAASENHDDPSTSQIKLVAEVKAGYILTFDAAVSSEEGADGLIVAVDSDAEFTLTGEQDWASYYYIFEEEGTYVITFKYVKDSSLSEGDDAAYIDNVYVGVNDFELEDITVPEQFAMVPGMEKAIDVVAVPSFVDYGTLTFESQDQEVATVDGDGVVTAVATGDTTITVTSDLLADVVKEVKISVVEPKHGNAFLLADDSYENEEGLYDVEFVTNTIEQKLAFSDFLGTYIVNSIFGPVEVVESVYAAEYFDGCIYMFTDTGRFLVIDAETYEVLVEVGDLETGENLMTDWMVIDLAFDYSTYTLYGVAVNAADEQYIVSVDMETGDIEEVAELPFNTNVLASDNGVFYVIESFTGTLYSIELTGGEVTATELAALGIPTGYIQTMAFDHATGELYWLGIGSVDGMNFFSFTAKINLETSSFDFFTENENLMEYSGLYFEYTDDSEKVNVTGVTLDETEVAVRWHEQVKLTATVAPADATNKNISWTSSDESVATVKGGVVTGVSEGEAIITVTTKDGGFTAEAKVVVTDGHTSIFSENFEPAADGSFPFTETWTIIDSDGDTYSWTPRTAQEGVDAHDGTGFVASASYMNELDSALYPDNWLISPTFTVYEDTFASWYVAALDPNFSAENYAVYVVPAEYDEAELENLTPIYEGTSTGVWANITVDISEYAGQEVRLAFRHYNVTDMFWIKLDTVDVYTFTQIAPIPEIKMGDVNGDGVTNTGDAVVILKYAADMIQLDSDQLVAANVDFNDGVDTYDAVVILQYAAGIITDFEAPAEPTDPTNPVAPVE